MAVTVSPGPTAARTLGVCDQYEVRLMDRGCHVDFCISRPVRLTDIELRDDYVRPALAQLRGEIRHAAAKEVMAGIMLGEIRWR